MSLIKDFFGADSLTDDKNLANTMLAFAKATSAAYLSASLESATPELRRLYLDFCTEVAQSHEALTALAIQKNWYNAYGEPISQLKDVIGDSVKVLNQNT